MENINESNQKSYIMCSIICRYVYDDDTATFDKKDDISGRKQQEYL